MKQKIEGKVEVEYEKDEKLKVEVGIKMQIAVDAIVEVEETQSKTQEGVRNRKTW